MRSLCLSFVLALCAVASLAETPVAFKGKWITDAKMASLTPKPVFARQLQKHRLPKPDPAVRNAHILFRKSFVASRPNRAVIRITADDYYKLYLNGEFVAQGPAAGTPDHTYCNEVDVTSRLRDGRNVLAVHTYYQGLVNRVWMSGDNRHGLLLDLVADGKTLVASDDSFLTARHGAFSALHTVGYDTQFMERYDAGAAEVGFERPDFDDSSWAKAVLHPLGGDYVVYAQPTPMLTFEKLSPVKVRTLKDGGLRLDFGGVYVGSLALAANGPKGGVVTLRCGQELLPDGAVRHKIRANCNYEEQFVLSGKGRDTLNQYDYKSFRYAELIPSPGVAIDAASVRLVARHMPFTLRAKPNFTDPQVMPIWNLCVDSFRYGVQEQIMDCMDREKGYYLGDGCYTMITYCRLTKEWAWARRFVDDFLRTAKIDRGLVTCANCSFMQEIAEYPLMFMWFVKAYLAETGDVAFVRERYAALADILDSYRERYAREDGLVRNLDKWCVVEWPRNFQDGYDARVDEGRVCTDMHNAINAWYVGAICCLNAIAEKVGKPRYADVDALVRSFQSVFYDRTRHLFVDREGTRHVSLPGNVYATFFGLEPQDDAAAHHAAFTALVREKGYAAISMFQFFPLFAWLRDNGETALFNELILSPDAWRRNLREGGTRTFEGWGRDTKWNTSLFHLTIASLAWFLCDASPNENANPPPAAERLSTGAETYWYPAKGSAAAGACVVVCPGGGYQTTCITYEGWALAEWLNAIGVSAVVLDYHTVGGTQRTAAPLGDLPLREVQETVRLVRSRAAKLGIAPARVGVMGFSAGGHLAASALTLSPPESRPDFGVLCYAVTQFGKTNGPITASQRNLLGRNATPESLLRYSGARQVTKETPPVFILSTDSDTVVPSENSIEFYLACRRAGVPAELHVWQPGAHGGGLCRDRPGEDQWPRLCETWMRNMKIIQARR